MLAATAMTTVCSAAFLVLTPDQRLEAMRNLHRENPLLQRGFIVTGLVTIAILFILLIAVHYYQRWKEYRSSKNWFSEFSRHNGLSNEEQELLRIIVDKSGIEQLDRIFTMPAAFDKGVNELLVQNAGAANPNFQEQIEVELVRLRSKLGFGAQVPGMAARGKVSSRSIPLGKAIKVSRRKSKAGEPLEGVLIRNDDIELTVRIPLEMKVSAGEVWILQYTIGASVCEFDAPVLRASQHDYVFGHSESVRFVSRRKFLRVQIDTRALVADFAFDRSQRFSAPDFRAARVKQIAGPGLLIESDLKVELGRRVLVVAEMPDGRVIEDVGEVRHVRRNDKIYTFAVELIGLGETEVDELICVTNAAAHAAKAETDQDSTVGIEVTR